MMLTTRFPHYQSTLSELWRIANRGIRLDLEPMRILSAALGDPWRSYPCVLVAGTNGKGSTCAVMSEILSSAGYRVGLYTSPHLSFYRERVVIKERGKVLPVHEPVWCSSFSRVHEAVHQVSQSFTQFEILTALAFTMFQEEEVDIAILEVGLGGRLDATNVAKPMLSVFTSIDHDHHEYLGNSLSSIAREKGGILREGGSAISAAQHDEVITVLQREAHRMRAAVSFIHPGKRLARTPQGQSFEYEGKQFEQSLIGDHQIENASVAIAAARQLRTHGFHVTEDAVATGVKNARWPARLECLFRSPDVFVDSAHNPAGSRALVLSLNSLELPRPHILILGILEDKEVSEMLSALEGWGDVWIFTQSFSPRALSPLVLGSKTQSLGIKKEVEVSGRVGEACRRALSLVNREGTIVAAGSLTTAGEARRLLLMRKDERKMRKDETGNNR